MRPCARRRANTIAGESRQIHLRSFPPIFRADARVLILGSMPGAESLRRGEYYAHPRNAFWPIMGALFSAGPDQPYRVRINRLRAAGVAIWDVIACCRRRGSLDAGIAPESIRPNGIPALIRRAPRLQWVFFNGQAAEYWFRRCFGSLLSQAPFCRLRWRRLPSTSPAHAALSFQEKLDRWRAAMAMAMELEAAQDTVTPPSRLPIEGHRRRPTSDLAPRSNSRGDHFLPASEEG